MRHNRHALRLAMSAALVTSLAGMARADDPPQAPAAAAPSLDKAVTLAPLSLKTKGKSPQEAFKMLGDAVGVTFVAGNDARVQPTTRGMTTTATVWDATYPPVDFDLDRVNFWAAAMRLADAPSLTLTGDGYFFTLSAQNPRYQKPRQTYDTALWRVVLYTGPKAGTVRLEFLLDPRLRIYAAGTLTPEALDEHGKPVTIDPTPAQFPVKALPTTFMPGHGILSIAGDVNLPGTLSMLRGNLTATVATASKQLEFDIVSGEVTDKSPHRVGDWTITASASHELGIAGSGPPRPNREFTLKVERMSDKAPPFPDNKSAIVHYVGTYQGPGNKGVKEPAAKDPRLQEWPVQLFSSSATKVVIDVPLEIKEVTIPFEFKNVEWK